MPTAIRSSWQAPSRSRSTPSTRRCDAGPPSRSLRRTRLPGAVISRVEPTSPVAASSRVVSSSVAVSSRDRRPPGSLPPDRRSTSGTGCSWPTRASPGLTPASIPAKEAGCPADAGKIDADAVRAGAAGAEAVGVGRGGAAALRRAAAGFGGAALGIARTVRADACWAVAQHAPQRCLVAGSRRRGGRDGCRTRVGGDRGGRGRRAWVWPE
jgi:hypothetical protein